MPTARLTDRSVVSVTGAEAKSFLDRIVTCDLDRVAKGRARFGALLTPQGKILADFIVVQRDDETFLLDVATACASDLNKRLTLYRLRAKVVLTDRSREFGVVVGWGADAVPLAGAIEDPRLPSMGWRAIVPVDELPAPSDEAIAAYHAHRIAHGLPEAGRDFPFGDAFPHEADMDQLSGVDFDKGCYVGQEVVSRMQHRGTARTRIVPVLFDGEAVGDAEITAGDRVLGRTGSAEGARALATIRLDRAQDAVTAGEAILAGGKPVRIEKPDWVRFAVPGETAVPAA